MICHVTDEPDLLLILHDLARQLRVDANRRASAYGMTRTQWVLLYRLEQQPGLSQKELSELLEVEPITVARLIDRLEERGMVQRRDDPRIAGSGGCIWASRPWRCWRSFTRSGQTWCAWPRRRSIRPC